MRNLFGNVPTRKVWIFFGLLATNISLTSQNLTSPEPLNVSFQFKTLFHPYKAVDTAFTPELYGGYSMDESRTRLRLELGNLGAPIYDILYNPLYNNYLIWGNLPFYHQRLRHENIRFYLVNAPLTEARYTQGYNRGQVFRIFHTQNIHRRWNYNIHWQRLNSEGFYPQMNTERSNFTISTHYYSPDDRYKFQGYYTWQKQLSNENGGLRFDSVFTENTRRERALVPVKFREGKSTSSQQAAYFQHTYDLLTVHSNKKESDSAKSFFYLGIGHRFHYARERYQYFKPHRPEDTLYFKEFNYSFSETQDSTTLTFLRNEVFATVGIHRSIQIRGGLGFQHSLHSSHYHSHYFSQYRTFAEGDWSLNRIFIQAGLSYHPAGEATGASGLYAKSFFRWYKNYEISAWLQNSVEAPHAFYSRHFSNLTGWNTSFRYTRYREFGGEVELPYAGKLTLRSWLNEGLLFIDSSLRPFQVEEPIGLIQTRWILEQKVSNWFTYRHTLAAQQTSRPDLLRLPEWMVDAEIFTRFYLFNRNLGILLGMGAVWFSKFDAMGYSPVLGTFYLAPPNSIGNTVLADAFVHFQIKSAVITLHFENATAGWLTPYTYFAADGYPMADPVLRVGILWRFFN
ncbi:MAG: putative porin [Thermaurantimonas sp.]